jgi:hypothetical protein
MLLTNTELYAINGGSFRFSLSGFNVLSRFYSTALKIGQIVGTNIHRHFFHNYC